jgi:hypothetical protein
MHLAQDNDVVHTFTPDRSDQPFHKAILPRRGWCGRLVPDAHGALSRNTERTFPEMGRGVGRRGPARSGSRGRGTLTVRGGNLFIIDDPLKPGDAESEATRQRVIEWYRSTLVTRPDDKLAARIVLVMQRIHVDDLVGYVLESDAGFEVLNLPAVAQSTTTISVAVELMSAKGRPAASRP